MSNDDRSVTIRLASQGDAEQLAHLCEQLGYPVATEHLSLRLTPLLLQRDHALFVAERPDGHLLGWVHVYRCFLVHTDPEAQTGSANRRIGGGCSRASQRCRTPLNAGSRTVGMRAGMLGHLFTLACQPH